MDYIEGFFSPTLDCWKKLRARTRPYALPGCAPESAIGIVNLARLTGKESLVPLALLCCCQLGGRILKGLARPDGTYEKLSTEDFERCLGAMDGLTSHGIRRMHALIGTRPQDPCLNSRTDNDGLKCLGGIYGLLEYFQLASGRGMPILPTPFVLPEMAAAETKRVDWEFLSAWGFKICLYDTDPFLIR
ncbi:uncharacterized protein BXZ73DRAFT_105762 [Epithele typhae]|uniref:uncharacterized protein n=1 Tax=Epithele typhae TaxID=378194 RepID=UPI00200831B1|nr:uncharacterized protein BXZ73DRAFT_105762 [Epithele typhae]KAH9916567.1 hypothetical protein BXZ73DRAFT_105762 [Epithele typhae]